MACVKEWEMEEYDEDRSQTGDEAECEPARNTITKRLSGIVNIIAMMHSRKISQIYHRRTTSGKTADDVVARLEILPDTKARMLFRGIYVGVFVSLIVLIVQVVLKGHGAFELDGNRLKMEWVNLAVGFACMVGMFLMLGNYIWRVITLHRDDVRWTMRRKRWTVLELTQLVAQTLNTVGFFIPNLLVVIYGHENVSLSVVKFSAVLRYTMWNTLFFLFVLQARVLNLWVDKSGRPIGEEDGILLDAPWSCHLFTLLYWGLFEAGLILGFWLILLKKTENGHISSLYDLCGTRSARQGIIGFITAMCVLYEIVALIQVRGCFLQLKKKSYNLFRWVNVRVRYNFIQVLVVETFVVLSFFLMGFVRIGDCSASILVLFGLVPAQIVMTVLGIVNGYLMMPMKLGLHVLNVRYSIAWTENMVQAKWTGGRSAFSKYRVPAFCYETCLKMWYFSLVAYRWVIEDKEVTMDVANKLYGLDENELIYVQESDMSVVVSWNVSKSIIVIAFRGTKSTENVLTDLRAWRTELPPKQGYLLLGTRPMVHKGFYSAWSTAGLNFRILNKVIQIVNQPGFKIDTCHVLTTGHSMGGALAVLAAYDIARYTGVPGTNITCHTFGAPCVGNSAFRRDFDAKIMDAWQIVNGNDIVPSLPEFGQLFSHVGKRVIVNGHGDIVLNPLFVESSLARFFNYLRSSHSMVSHLMRNYRKSLEAIARAQYIKRKGVPGGMEAMEKLMEEGDDGVLHLVLRVKGKEFKELHRLGTEVWRGDELMIQVKQDRRRKRRKDRQEVKEGSVREDILWESAIDDDSMV